MVFPKMIKALKKFIKYSNKTKSLLGLILCYIYLFALIFCIYKSYGIKNFRPSSLLHTSHIIFPKTFKIV